MAFLEIKNLTKRFGNVSVLKGINLSVEKGEVVSVIGSSGGGKTTFLRCLNFLERPNSGSIRIGKDMFYDVAESHTEREIREMRLHCGLVFQSFNLFPQHSIRKNLTLAAELFEKERLKKEKATHTEIADVIAAINDRASELLSTVGLTDKADAYPCQLSGGQQQRVAIARALMLSPEILCFDEPTSALDPELTGEVLRVIRSLKDSERTMIIVTHEMEFARHVSDKVIFITDGVIAEEGTPDEIFDNPQTEKLQAFLSHTKKDTF